MGHWKNLRRISGAIPPLKLPAVRSAAYVVRICAGIGLSLGILAPAHAAQTADADTVAVNSFDDRVDAVRMKLGIVVGNPGTSVSGPDLAQWNNWENNWQNY